MHKWWQRRWQIGTEAFYASGAYWLVLRWRWWRGLSVADRYLLSARMSPAWCREYDRVKVRGCH